LEISRDCWRYIDEIGDWVPVEISGDTLEIDWRYITETAARSE
jgi:hypothetical protein